jgi:hypothetical protein
MRSFVIQIIAGTKRLCLRNAPTTAVDYQSISNLISTGFIAIVQANRKRSSIHGFVLSQQSWLIG